MAKAYFRHVHAIWFCWYGHRMRHKDSEEIELSVRAASNTTLGASFILLPGTLFFLILPIFPIDLPSRGVFLLAALVIFLLIDRRLERYFQRVKDDILAEAKSYSGDPDKGAWWALRRGAAMTLVPVLLFLSALILAIQFSWPAV